MTAFLPRDLTVGLRAALRSMPVVVVSGPRQSGKTTFLRRQPELSGRRYVSLDDFASLDAARRDPEGLLAGKDPITIDEAQRCPEILTAIKREVDHRRLPGRFLLSGSANFALLHGVSESLAGRAVYLALHPFTRRELRGAIETAPFLRRFFDEPGSADVGGPPPTPIRDAEVLLGGMPSVCLGEAEDPAVWFRGYEQTYLERDVRALSQVADLVAFRSFLRLAALRSGQILNQSQLARDARLTAMTAGRYLALLETAFLVSRLPPFLSNRASRLIKSPKLHLADSGLLAHLAGVSGMGPDEPLRGALLETYVAQNLAGILTARWPEATLATWNVQGRHEVDFVIEQGRDTLAIEVKAGTRWTAKDLAGLKALQSATPRCKAAILAHNGRDAVRLGDRLWALPLDLVLS